MSRRAPKIAAEARTRQIMLSSMESTVLACVDGATTVEEIADITGMDVPEVTRRLRALHEAGVVAWAADEPAGPSGGPAAPGPEAAGRHVWVSAPGERRKLVPRVTKSIRRAIAARPRGGDAEAASPRREGAIETAVTRERSSGVVPRPAADPVAPESGSREKTPDGAATRSSPLIPPAFAAPDVTIRHAPDRPQEAPQHVERPSEPRAAEPKKTNSLWPVPTSPASHGPTSASLRARLAQAKAAEYHEAARTALVRESFSEAVNLFQLASDLSDDPILRKELADEHAQAKRALYVRMAGSYIKQAEKAERAEQWADAGELYAKAFEGRREPSLADRAIRAFLRHGDPAKQLPRAMGLAEAAVDEAPNDPVLRLALAHACIAADQGARAREQLERALKLDPKSKEARELLERVKRSR